MKKVILILIIGSFSIVAANDCDYYAKKAQYYQEKSLKTTNMCDYADALEQAVNYMGSARNSCANGYQLDSTIKKLSAALLQASIKCGH